MIRHSVYLLPLCLAFGLIGCTDPADDAPAASVSEAVMVDADAAANAVDATPYVISDASTLTFVGSKVTGKHDGGFNEFEGVIRVPNDDLTQAQITVDIDATSIWADNDKLTDHLKSADFFEVEKYPTAQFVSTEIEPADDGYLVTGNLELHGETNSVQFPVQISLEGDILTATADFSIERSKWGINYKGKPDDLIRERVVVRFDLTAERQDVEVGRADQSAENTNT